jgi:hypothetical protein
MTSPNNNPENEPWVAEVLGENPEQIEALDPHIPDEWHALGALSIGRVEYPFEDIGQRMEELERPGIAVEYRSLPLEAGERLHYLLTFPEEENHETA